MAAAFAQRHLASRSCQLWSLAKFSSQSRPDEMTDRIIRVDHAGEYGADRIYAGQLAVLQSTSIGPTIHVSVICCQFCNFYCVQLILLVYCVF